jgi:hypothetical protein
MHPEGAIARARLAGQNGNASTAGLHAIDGSADPAAKITEIEAACSEGNLDRIRELAISQAGLISDQVRCTACMFAATLAYRRERNTELA